MLPFLPALILLMLQGPAGLETAGGRLPAAIKSIQQHMSSPEAQRAAEEEALATLLAFSHDREFSEALVVMLRLVSKAEPEAHVRPEPYEEPRTQSPPCPALVGLAQNGFAASQRSRDGPLAR